MPWTWKQWAALTVMILGLAGVIVVLCTANMDEGGGKAAILVSVITTLLGMLGLRKGSPNYTVPRKMVLVAFFLWLVVGATGCGPTTGLTDLYPRARGTLTIDAKLGGDQVSFRREAPAPFWVENHWRFNWKKPKEQNEITVEFNPKSGESAGLFGRLFSFLGSLVGLAAG